MSEAQVGYIRSRVVRAVIGLKAYISSIDGPKEMLGRMSGRDGEERLQRIVEYIMVELGVENKTDFATRKAIKKVLGS